LVISNKILIANIDFEELVKETLVIKNRFKTRLGKQGRMLDLMEEVGELASAMLYVDGGKTSGNPDRIKTRKDIADGLADVLYSLILLADHYKIDLPKEYSEMLQRCKWRFEKGELV